MTIESVTSYISRLRTPEDSIQKSVISQETIKALLSLGLPGGLAETAENKGLEKSAIDTFA
ncbi:MAG: hypothetical protein JW904_08040 [Spirochaetales bacterium]|nr:hypothetical protein [Spirochaetales bacterium]